MMTGLPFVERDGWKIHAFRGASFNGQMVRLTARPLSVLYLLAASKTILTRGDILDALDADTYYENVNQNVTNLRRTIKACGLSCPILTVGGVGYMWGLRPMLKR